MKRWITLCLSLLLLATLTACGQTENTEQTPATDPPGFGGGNGSQYDGQYEGQYSHCLYRRRADPRHRPGCPHCSEIRRLQFFRLDRGGDCGVRWLCESGCSESGRVLRL